MLDIVHLLIINEYIVITHYVCMRIFKKEIKLN